MKTPDRVKEYRENIFQRIKKKEDLSDLIFEVEETQIGVLELSAYLEDYDSVQALLEYGLNPNGKTDLDGLSPLLISVGQGNSDISDLLIKYRADVNQADDFGITPLFVATSNGDVNLSKKLIIAGANLYKSDFYGQSAISAAGYSDNNDIFDLYLRSMLKDNDYRDQYDNIFFSAISANNMVFVKSFIDNIDNIDIRNNQGKSALHIAVENDNIEVIPLLLSKGVSVDAKDKQGDSIGDLSYQCQHLSNSRRLLLNNLIENYKNVAEQSKKSEAEQIQNIQPSNRKYRVH